MRFKDEIQNIYVQVKADPKHTYMYIYKKYMYVSCMNMPKTFGFKSSCISAHNNMH